VTIHSSDPFATPEDQRSPLRRLRGRMASPVTLWTAGADRSRAGLTVSSVLIVDGRPGRVAGIVDEESDLWSSLESTGRFVVSLLGPGDEQAADRFAGLLPAPGGLFRDPLWTDTAWGPVREGTSAWVGCRLDAGRPYGWGLLVEATIDEITLNEPVPPLVHYRGRYRGLSGAA
jgi:3-hydroxy-9,10-secoandrosta-1,3,5(10)-triene-9,17-dione monooxygenase reductase component